MGQLLRRHPKMPWELGPADIQANMAWMKTQGHTDGTLANRVTSVANFYRWCDERGVDPQCAPGFNPVAGVNRPKVRYYEHAELLSRGEVQALLGILKRESTPLGNRDSGLGIRDTVTRPDICLHL